MNADGWARESAFRKFYDNQLAQSQNFGEQLLLHSNESHKLTFLAVGIIWLFIATLL